MKPTGCVERCPACPQRDLLEQESLQKKALWVAEELKFEPRPIIGPVKRWGYRRKALLHARLIEGAWQFGVVKMRGPVEEFIPIPNCPLHHPEVNAHFLRASKSASPTLPIAFGLASGAAFTLVLKSTKKEALLQELKSWSWPSSSSLFVNWNPVAGKRAIDSRHTELIVGEKWLEEDGLIHGPSAFRQQIPEMEDYALRAAGDFLALAKTNVAVDFYSGLGASLKAWLGRGWQAIGVELSGESLAAAVQNAPGAHLLRGRTEHRLPQVQEFIHGRRFVVYTNPPRSGHTKAVLNWMLEQRPERIAYLSCHPRSLAGDLRELLAVYELVSLQPMDFFPQTNHVETLALLKARPMPASSARFQS